MGCEVLFAAEARWIDLVTELRDGDRDGTIARAAGSAPDQGAGELLF